MGAGTPTPSCPLVALVRRRAVARQIGRPAWQWLVTPRRCGIQVAIAHRCTTPCPSILDRRSRTRLERSRPPRLRPQSTGTLALPACKACRRQVARQDKENRYGRYDDCSTNRGTCTRRCSSSETVGLGTNRQVLARHRPDTTRGRCRRAGRKASCLRSRCSSRPRWHHPLRPRSPRRRQCRLRRALIARRCLPRVPRTGLARSRRHRLRAEPRLVTPGDDPRRACGRYCTPCGQRPLQCVLPGVPGGGG